MDGEMSRHGDGVCEGLLRRMVRRHDEDMDVVSAETIHGKDGDKG